MTFLLPILALLVGVASAQAETCHKTKSEIDRDQEFKAVLNGRSVFGTWRGPMKSSIEVRPNGKTTLHHPIKGKINLSVSLCREGDEVYLRMNGKKIAFADSALESVRISDPQDPKKRTHLFRHVQ